MSAKTDAELTSLNNSRLPDNTTRFISAEKVRSQNQDMIDSKLNKQDAFTNSASNPLSILYLKSPDNTVWRITIDNSGIITPESI